MREIERKFLLVDQIPPENPRHKPKAIKQGYVAVGEGAEVRLRAKGDRYFLTVKKGSGLVREEYESELTAEQFEELWPATENRRLEKIRQEVAVTGGVAEVDVYSGSLAGLATVEVEFASEKASADFRAPSWFGKEVTGDDRYSNRVLAVNGLPEPLSEFRKGGDKPLPYKG